MPAKVALQTLNASTIDILNTIRQYASADYQSLVPAVTTVDDIPKVGECLLGYPALANQFVSALVNRIAFVGIKSATFNNDYAELKKGMLQYGETVEEVFVQIAKAREFSVEKAPQREFQRTLPDVRTAFHCINWKVQYPITVQQEDIRMAFVSADGVQDLIARIINSVYVAEQYDEFLLFKYLLIKAVANGKIKPYYLGATPLDDDIASAFRGTSNLLTFMKKDYNENGVTTNTPKEDQYIFMDAAYNGRFDVNVLAHAFNMEKAEFMGKLKLIDDWTSFDNDRFDVIRANSNGLEEVTSAELAKMATVKAILVDKEWFQVYDNLFNMSETPVHSGLYWNYFLNVWKTVSSSPFSNAIVFQSLASETARVPVGVKITDLAITPVGNATRLAMALCAYDANGLITGAKFHQTSDLTEAGIAVTPFGMVMVNDELTSGDTTFEYEYNGITYEVVFDLTEVAAGDTATNRT